MRIKKLTFSRLAMRSKSSPPAAYSRTMKISDWVSMNSNSLIVWGLLNLLKILSSRLTFSKTPYYLIFFLFRILMATLCPVCSWNATIKHVLLEFHFSYLLLTFPKEPLPKFLANLYWPILISFIDIFILSANYFLKFIKL
jgi:hypothetical protein